MPKTIGAKQVKTLKVNIGLEDDSSEAIIEDVHLYDYALFPEELTALREGKPSALSSVESTEFRALGAGEDAGIPIGITYSYINGQRVAQARDGVFTWYHTDHLGSSSKITDINGEEVRSITYKSFGEEADNIGTGEDPKYKYTGKEQDATGLYYYGARYYDPALSRFITADTVYDVAPQGLNRYSYALNNPIRYNDPTGNFSIYTHIEGAGHVGVQVTENGELKNYDFGRYHGKYKLRYRLIRQYKGPNILKVTIGQPYVLKKKSGKSREFRVSEQLDKVIADKFKQNFDNGLSQIPENVKKKMNNQKELPPNARYMESDWGLLGPNCLTFSFDTLNEALDKVINGENVPEELRREAKDVKSKLEKLESIYPKGVSNNLDKKLEEQDVPPSHIRQILPESLFKDDPEAPIESDLEESEVIERERMEEE